jgi:ribonuclease T2
LHGGAPVKTFAALALTAATLAFAAPANAQSRSGNFDFYVLALSWSPSFCALEGREKGREQCDGPAKGFVLHGLWPQYERGFPSNCEHSFRNAPNSVIQQIRGLFPEEGLARHQWRKHGTCSGQTPTAYFADVKRAVEKVKIPDSFNEAREGGRVNPRDIERKFIDANQGLRPGMLATTCVRGMLQEVRVCMSKDLREFRPCPDVVRSSCRAQEVTAPTR